MAKEAVLFDGGGDCLNTWTIQSNSIIVSVDDISQVFALETLVKSVLNLRYSSSQKWFHFAELSPFRTYFGLHFDDEEVFFPGPLSSDNLWVEHIVPSFTTLAAKSAF